MSFIPTLLTTAAGGAQGAGQMDAMGGTFGMLIPLILIFAIMYFLMIRPQQKKQKETQKMIDAIKKGDKVVTIGGIHGIVSSVKENTLVIKVDDNTRIEFNRTAIATVVTDKPASDGKDVTESKNSEVTEK
ncbi:MAG: preprotein translocase subunit YajC [Treponema sp.]|nr:preprotein translocase subunit YajC [Treponema sp.]MBP5575175.1 preprotein translocase subunit YajC [Treponema sp.]MCR5317855.1 preprotein translocase subunit YajC [Treponema sp.]